MSIVLECENQVTPNTAILKMNGFLFNDFKER